MQRFIKKGSADQTIDVKILDSSSTVGAGLTGLVFNTANLTCYYRRGATGTPTAISLATQTVGGAHSDGGFVAVDGTNMPGVYRLDLPDAVLASGVPWVTLQLKGAANMVPCDIIIQLEAVPADVTHVNGVPQLSTYTPQINAVVTGTPTTTEIEFSSSGLNTDNTFAGWHAFFADGDCAGCVSEVTAAEEAGGTFTLTLETLPATPDADDNVVLYPPGQLPNVDGIRAAVYHEALLAFIAGKVTISGSDPYTVTYFKQDGSTGRFSIVAAANGSRAAGADFTP